MTSESLIRLYLLFKITTIGIGFLIIIMGFFLLMKGLSSSTGEIQLSFAGKKITFRNASPGIYLFVVGGIMIGVAVFRGIELKSQKKQFTNSIDSTSLVIDSDTKVSVGDTVTVDSLYNLAQKEFTRDKLLNAYRLCCFAKGIALTNDSIPIRLKDDINLTMKNIEQRLNKIATKGEQVPLSSEETQSVTISEDQIDTTK
jgi:hypothetical protein